MALLQAILDKNIQLFDYEAIAEDVVDESSGKVKKRREFRTPLHTLVSNVSLQRLYIFSMCICTS